MLLLSDVVKIATFQLKRKEERYSDADLKSREKERSSGILSRSSLKRKEEHPQMN